MAGRKGSIVCLQRLVPLVALTAFACATQPQQTEIDPRGASLLGEAQQAHRQGAYAQTVELVDSAARYIPQVPSLWFLRGMVLSELYRFEESDSAFERVVSLDPEYRSARFSMGHNAFLQSSYFARDAFRSALKHYKAEEALLRGAIDGGKERPGDREALATVLLQIGTTYARLHVPDSARLAYSHAIEVDSLSARGYAWLAAVQEEQGELESALTNARRASDLEPENPESRLLLGTLLTELGRFEEALPHLRLAVQAEPWNRTAVYNLGRALVGTDETDEGQIYLAKSDSLEMLREEIDQNHLRIFQEPNDPIRWENYAYLLHRAGRNREAMQAVAVMRYLQEAQ